MKTNRLMQMIGCVCVSLILCSCQEKTEKNYQQQGKTEKYYQMKGEIYGTYYSIIYGAESECVEIDKLDSVFALIDNSLSTFVPTSVISRVNQNDPTVKLDDYFVTVFRKGQYISKMTDGAFDMTVAPLVNCWGFGFKKSDQVTPQMIETIKQYVGYQKVRLEDNKIIKENPNIMLDASAIAKGFSCDVVAHYLASLQIKNYMVEIGGEIVTAGKNSHGETWNIGITQPTETNGIESPDLQTVVCLTGVGLATSGNYRQFYYKDGKRYSHTINPHTGFPAERNLLSATVIAPDCMTADAYATSFMVMGLDSAYAFASQQNDLAAYFIYSDDQNQLQVKYTDSFKQYLKFAENE